MKNVKVYWNFKLVCSQLCGSIHFFSQRGQEKAFAIIKTQVFAECHVSYMGAGIWTPAPMIAHKVLLTAETFLQSCYVLLWKEIMTC